MRLAQPIDMSTPNPLAPQGSLLEQRAKGRSMFHVISFIGAVHVMLLCGILWTACSNEKAKVEPPSNTLGSDPYSAAPPDNSLPGSTATNNPVGSLPPVSNIATPAGGSAPAIPGANPAPSTPPATPGPGAAPALPPSTPSTTPGANSTPETTTPAATAAAGEYKVIKGDIGDTIAKKNGVSIKALVAANPSVNWTRLKVGQTLQIPATGAGAGATAGASPTATDGVVVTPSGTISYVVKAGDTGTKIATTHGVKWIELRRASHLKSDALRPGQKLTTPSHGAATESPQTPPATPAGGTKIPTATPAPRGPGQ